MNHNLSTTHAGAIGPQTPSHASFMLAKFWRRYDQGNLLFLAGVHAAGTVGAATYIALRGVSTAAVVAAVLLAWITIFAISAGYHRLFAHRTYEAHPVFRVFLLLFGAGAFQTSALEWAANHRRHHARTDTDGDPYSVTRGFWHAHVGWVIAKADLAAPTMALKDLRADPLLMWQHRHFVPVASLMAFGLPLLVGVLFGDPLGFLLVAGFARMVFVYQVTFAINSFAHLFGTQPYSNRDSSRDSLAAALLTCGEGYHNFHHAFPADYRNGVRLHQFDPTKWILFTLSKVRLVNGLRRTPAEVIERARQRMRAVAVQTSHARSAVALTARVAHVRRPALTPAR